MSEPDFYDELDDALADCCMFESGGFWMCAAAGSEHCDWNCPFSDDIGKPVEDS